MDIPLSVKDESRSDFHDVVSCNMATVPSRVDSKVIVKVAWIDTPLGAMLAAADEQGLYLLEFVDRRGLELEIKRLSKRIKITIFPGENAILQKIRHELKGYFSGESSLFKTPINLIGSDFQKCVWRALQQIPVGQTRSYLDIANYLQYPTACRAVARANGSNPLSIIIPCHRVINHNGNLGGYSGGIARKQWLLDHEKNY